MSLRIVAAVFRRNFLAYFSSPTGYVFIFVFVLLSSLAAFWPNDFFVANLCNLDQLNRAMPLILLVFIPSIAMGIWADERRQGTDELLLTIPATDLDVVVGKYLAAVCAYSAALGFSLVCNFVVLTFLGAPDVGLLLATYFGYWLVGSAMLAVGMVGSFLTGNVTVAFVLGALLNAPLVFAVYANTILPASWSHSLARFSVGEQFRDLGRGVVSLSNVLYFVGIVAAMLYLSMVLIARRHWTGGKDAGERAAHYLARGIALLVFVGSLVALCERSGLRADITSEGVNSLSPTTRKLLAELDPPNAIVIDAYVSKEVPESYVQTRLNLLTALEEFKALGGNKLTVQVHDTDSPSDEAEDAEKSHGITPRTVFARSRGAMQEREVFLGVAVQSGLKKVVLPFVDFGTPVEYELIRSILTVGREKRLRVGVVKTPAQMMGGFNPMAMQMGMGNGPTPKQRIVEELEKQYGTPESIRYLARKKTDGTLEHVEEAVVRKQDPNAKLDEKDLVSVTYGVLEVDLVKPIEVGKFGEGYDVLLVVQPSSLSGPEMKNLIAAIRDGQPTAVFEDPLPYFGGFMLQGTPAYTERMMSTDGSIDGLWELLSLNASRQQPFDPATGKPRPTFNPRTGELDPPTDAADQVVWQDYNPFTRFPFPQEFVFIGAGASDEPVFSKVDPTISGLQQLLFVFPGSVATIDREGLKFEPLAMTGTRTGFDRRGDVMPNLSSRSARWPRFATGEMYTMAVHIQGTAKPAEKPRPINVIYVADVDCLLSPFFELASQIGNPENPELDLRLDNVPFVLNVVDVLSGDDKLVEVRKRRPKYRTLKAIEDKTESSREKAAEALEAAQTELTAKTAEKRKELKAKVDALKASEKLDILQMSSQVSQMLEANSREMDVLEAQLNDDLKKRQKEIALELANETAAVQRRYKLWAVLVPPILPLLVGLAVWVHRRGAEREGVAASRMR